MKSRILRGLILVAITACAVPAYAFLGSPISFDPVAKAQRLILIAEQKIQTFKAIQMIQETIKNVKMAERMYEMAKRGYERLRDPEEWRALQAFAKRRMETIIDPNANPYDSSLARMIGAMDRSLDNYAASLDGVRWLSSRVDTTDSQVAGFLDSIPLVGRWEEGEQWAKNVESSSYARRYGNPESFVRDAEAKFSSFDKQASQMKAEKTGLDQDSKKMEKALYAAQDAFVQARFDMEQQGKDGEEAAKMNAFQVRKSVLDQLHRDKEELDRQKADLTSRMAGLAQNILEKKDQVDRLKSVMAFKQSLDESWVKVQLSHMAGLANHLERIESICFTFLVITLAMALLWWGMGAYRGNQDILIPHDVLIGLIAAVMFVWPRSPVAVHRVTETMAVCVDAITMTFAKEAGNPLSSLSWMTTNTVNALQEIETEKEGVLENIVGNVTNIPMKILAGIHTVFMGTISFLVSLAGTVAVYASLMVRNLMFWVLMMISPLFLCLAPLPYARKNLLPAWGGMLYGTILWGPVVYVMLMVINLMMRQMSDITVAVYSNSPMADVFINAFNGILMVVAMVLAPVMVFGITQGSFGAVTGAVGSVATSALTMGSAAAVTGSGIMMTAAGNTMAKGGGFLGAAGSVLNSRGYRGVGLALQQYGSNMNSGGTKLRQAGTLVNTVGINMMKHKTGLAKVLPRKEKPVTPGANLRM